MASIETRVANLERKHSNLLHYWKVRCKEKSVWVGKKDTMHRRIKHLELMEKRLAELFSRKFVTIKHCYRDKKGEALFPLWLSHNQNNRLKNLLNGTWHKRYVQHRRGKNVMHFTVNEANKLRRMLRRGK